MTTTYRKKAWQETIAQSLVEELRAQNAQLKRRITELLDNKDEVLPAPTPGVIAALEAIMWTDTMNGDSPTLNIEDLAWLKLARAAVREAGE